MDKEALEELLAAVAVVLEAQESAVALSSLQALVEAGVEEPEALMTFYGVLTAGAAAGLVVAGTGGLLMDNLVTPHSDHLNLLSANLLVNYKLFNWFGTWDFFHSLIRNWSIKNVFFILLKKKKNSTKYIFFFFFIKIITELKISESTEENCSNK